MYTEERALAVLAPAARNIGEGEQAKAEQTEPGMETIGSAVWRVSCGSQVS